MLTEITNQTITIAGVGSGVGVGLLVIIIFLIKALLKLKKQSDIYKRAIANLDKRVMHLEDPTGENQISPEEVARLNQQLLAQEALSYKNVKAKRNKKLAKKVSKEFGTE